MDLCESAPVFQRAALARLALLNYLFGGLPDSIHPTAPQIRSTPESSSQRTHRRTPERCFSGRRLPRRQVDRFDCIFQTEGSASGLAPQPHWVFCITSWSEAEGARPHNRSRAAGSRQVYAFPWEAPWLFGFQSKLPSAGLPIREATENTRNSMEQFADCGAKTLVRTAPSFNA